MSEEKIEKLEAKTTAAAVALAYTLANLSAKFSDTKPAVIQALKFDAKMNENNNELLSKSLMELANFIEKFRPETTRE